MQHILEPVMALLGLVVLTASFFYMLHSGIRVLLQIVMQLSPKLTLVSLLVVSGLCLMYGISWS